ncbi:hypothetical protein [Kocuria sp. TGY1127_2]|uniref:hypothetical protein n=1 Tax=Kocuria sp. TGY1127_2 TaxID=2711328 RepID=UPI0015BF7EC9|nr:hypothetical protein [Kocuria sp. TGY1127_2]
MRQPLLLTIPALALAALALSAPPATAHEGHTQESTTTDEGSWTTMAHLDSLNNSGTTGEASVKVDGNKATVSMTVQGAAETFQNGPFPHAQHIHIGAAGTCPGPELDQNGDGAVSTPEAHPAYGMIASSLTETGDTSPDSALAVDRFPGGSSYTYERSIDIDDATQQALKDGTAVMVVHGVDPANLSQTAQQEMSPLDDSLPLAATLPAACGTLNASQMGDVPDGGADTGVGQKTDPASIVITVGAGAAGLVAVGGGAVYLRRRQRA